MTRVYKGGARNTVPKPGSPDLRDVNNVEDLYKKVGFYNILAHGTMPEETHSVFLVPDATWIMFITRAGIPAGKFKPGILGETLNDFYYLKPNESEQSWYTRIYAAMDSGQLFKGILYNKSPTEQFSIYEPGDLIQDLDLQFINESWPYMRLGVWKCPIAPDAKELLDIINDASIRIKHDKDLNEIFAKFEKLKTELPTYEKGINKIVKRFQIIAVGDLSAERELEFLHDEDVEKALEIQQIKKIFLEFENLLSIYAKRDLETQYGFFKHRDNLINLSPSIEKGRLNSNLYNLITEKRFNYTGKTLSDELLLPMQYRFIVVDACRSIESPSKPYELYKSRAALTRSVSVITRGEMCVTNLLQLTKSKFDQLLKSGENPTLSKLVNGEKVLLNDFEKSLTGAKNTLRTFLERQQFKKGDVVYVASPNSNDYTTVVSNITLGKDGTLSYLVINPNAQSNEDQYILVPATNVFKSEENISAIQAELFTEDFEKLTANYKRKMEMDQKIKKQMNTIRPSKLEEKKKALYEEAYIHRRGQIYGDSTTFYKVGQNVFTRVTKKDVPIGTYGRIKELMVNPNTGELGYKVEIDDGPTKFYGIEEVNSSEVDIEYTKIQKGIADSTKRFPIASRVLLSGFEKTPFLNNKIGIIVNIKNDNNQIKYLVKVYFQKPGTVKEDIYVIPLDPTKLSLVDPKTPTGIPKNEAAPVEKAELYTLAKENANSVEKEVYEQALRELRYKKKGGKRKTRRSQQKKSKKTRKH